MPWNNETQAVLGLAFDLKFITIAELESIKALLQEDGNEIETPITEHEFSLGKNSISLLAGLKPEMVQIVKRAIQLTTQDFNVYETLRSPMRQQEMVAKGTSKTLKSKHLRQADGFAHAMDLVPWINNALAWDWDGCYKIALAVDLAATELGFADNIRWGGAWDRVLSDFGGNVDAYKKEVELYRSRHPGPDFIDGPHFEWVA